MTNFPTTDATGPERCFILEKNSYPGPSPARDSHATDCHRSQARNSLHRSTVTGDRPRLITKLIGLVVICSVSLLFGGFVLPAGPQAAPEPVATPEPLVIASIPANP